MDKFEWIVQDAWQHWKLSTFYRRLRCRRINFWRLETFRVLRSVLKIALQIVIVILSPFCLITFLPVLVRSIDLTVGD